MNCLATDVQDFFQIVGHFALLPQDPSADHHKVSGSNISRTVRPRVTKFYTVIQAALHQLLPVAIIGVRKKSVLLIEFRVAKLEFRVALNCKYYFASVLLHVL